MTNPLENIATWWDSVNERWLFARGIAGKSWMELSPMVRAELAEIYLLAREDEHDIQILDRD